MTEHKRTVAQLKTSLASMGFRHTSHILAELIDHSETQELSYKDFLALMVEKELQERNERRRKRNLSGAHFPPNPRPLEYAVAVRPEGRYKPYQ